MDTQITDVGKENEMTPQTAPFSESLAGVDTEFKDLLC